jgi:hypothetical protein
MLITQEHYAGVTETDMILLKLLITVAHIMGGGGTSELHS